MSHVYVEIDDNIDASEGEPVGNGWRLLRCGQANDGHRRVSILFNPATDERVIHVGPLSRKRVSSLIRAATRR